MCFLWHSNHIDNFLLHFQYDRHLAPLFATQCPTVFPLLVIFACTHIPFLSSYSPGKMTSSYENSHMTLSPLYSESFTKTCNTVMPGLFKLLNSIFTNACWLFNCDSAFPSLHELWHLSNSLQNPQPLWKRLNFQFCHYFVLQSSKREFVY